MKKTVWLASIVLLVAMGSVLAVDGYVRHTGAKYMDSDFETGSLRQKSNIRPNRLFTADKRIVLYQLGHLMPQKVGEVIEQVLVIIGK